MSKPGNIQLIAVMYLVDGLLNIAWGGAIFFGLFSSLIGLIGTISLLLYNSKDVKAYFTFIGEQMDKERGLA